MHFFNGVFKLGLVGRSANKEVVLRFGIPAIFAAALGAWVLSQFVGLPPLLSYSVSGKQLKVHPVKLVIATLIILFTLIELIPRLRELEFSKKYLSLGGFISGFFGGLSGHQGALRSAFLARVGLDKIAFVGTGVVIAVIIDVTRLFVYSSRFKAQGITANLPLLGLTIVFAFLGAYVGNKQLKKMTMKSVQTFVSVSLIILSLALASGLI